MQLKKIALGLLVIIMCSSVLADTFQDLYDDPFNQTGELQKEQRIITKHIYMPNSENIEYDDGTGQIRIGLTQIYADSKGTKLDQAKSLKNCEFCGNLKMNLDLDPSFNLTIEDYNMTDYTNVCFMSNQTGDIPIRINLLTNKAEKVIDTNIKTTKQQVDTWRCYNFTVPTSILDYEIEWGWNSTTILFNNTISRAGATSEQTTTSSTYSTARYGPGDTLVTSSFIKAYSFEAVGVTGLYGISRIFLPYNTSGIPLNADIISAKLFFSTPTSGVTDQDADGNNFITVINPTNQTSISILATTDFPYCGPIDNAIEVSNRLNLSKLSASNTYNFSINITIINRTSNTLLGIREGHDLLNDAIAANTYSGINITFAVNTPYLEIKYFIGYINSTVGIFNNTYFNLTENSICLNQTNGNGTYITEVFNITTGNNMLNLTAYTSSSAGYEVQGSVREFLSMDNSIVGLWMEFQPNTLWKNYGVGGTALDFTTIAPNSIYSTESYNDTYGTTNSWNFSGGNPGMRFYGTAQKMNFSTKMVCSWHKPQGVGYFWNGAGFQTQCDNSGYYYFQYPGLSDDFDVTTINGKSCKDANWTFVCHGYNGSNYLRYRDGTYAVGDATSGSTTWNNEIHIGLSSYMKIAMVIYINGTKNQTWLDEVYNKTRMSWQPYKTYQTFSSGTVTNNYSISSTTKFVQAKFNFYSNTTENSKLFNYNITPGNYNAPSDISPPSYSNIGVSNTNPSILDNVIFSSYWTDNVALDKFIYSWNATGLSCDTWANDSSAAFSSGWANVTKQIPATCVGKITSIGWQVFANDTSGNKNNMPITMSFSSIAASDLCAPPTIGTFNVTQWCNFTSTYQISGDINCSSTGIMNISGTLNFTGTNQKFILMPGCKRWMMPTGRWGKFQ